MESNPIRSSFFSVIYKFHEDLIVRRHIVSELSSQKLQHVVIKPMLKYYVSLIIASVSLNRILKKESFKIRFVCCCSLFSFSYLYLQLFYEEKVFLSKGLEDTQAGEIIRKGYLNSLPTSWISQKFEIREKELESFKNKYYHVPNTLEKFEKYAEKRKFSLKELKI